MLKGKPLVMIGVPSNGLWKAPMGHNAIMLASVSVHNGVLVDCISWDSCYTEINRNNIVKATLEMPAPIDAILWIDSDMKFPFDGLQKLWNRDKPIVGATYRERNHPRGYLGAFLDGNDEHCRGDGLRKMETLPGGFILVGLDVYRKVPKPWYRAPIEEGEPRDDYYFCHKARAAGFDVWCDLDLTRRVMHRGEADVPWFTEEMGARIVKASKG